MVLAALLAAVAVSAGPGEATGAVAPDTATPAVAATEAPTATATPTPTATATPTPTAPPTYVVPLTIHLGRGEADPPDAVAQTPPAEAHPAEGAPAEAGAPEHPELAAAPLGPTLADSPPVLLSRVGGPRGRAIERLIEPSGEIVEHEVNAAGTVQACRPVGRLDALRIVAQQPAAGGEFVHVVRDASGALVRVVVAADGAPRAVALLAPPP